VDSAARRAERMARLSRELRRMTVLHRLADARRRGRLGAGLQLPAGASGTARPG